MQLGQAAMQHQDTLEIVKARVGITHTYFDCWIYGFLENKNFDVEETVAKLIRRDAMERKELASYDISDYMREQMAKGIIQLIGDDKEGRVTFYIVTKRDFPASKRREENKRNFDMWLSYGTRLRKENQKCRITMLVNQTDASMWSNTDMTFQADVALRIAKYYPGAVDRMYICKMNRTLAAVAKPIFSRLPKVVSERMRIFTESDIEKGRLLELFDEDVLPIALGGKNAIDGPSNWNRFGEIITHHFTQLKTAVADKGQGVKEWELEQLLKEQECRDSVSDTEAAPPPAEPAMSRELRAQHHRKHRRAKSGTPIQDEMLQSLTIAPTTSAGGHISSRSRSHNQQLTIQVQNSNHEEGSTTPQDFATMEEATAIDMTDLGTLLSCNSTSDDELEMGSYSPIQRGGDDGRTPQQRYSNPRVAEWALGTHNRTLSMAQASDAVVMLEMHEVTFRTTIEEMEAMERLLVIDRFGPMVEGSVPHTDYVGIFGTHTVMSYFPAPLRSVIRGVMWILCVIMAFYFLMATVFAGSIGVSMMVAFFAGMYSETYNVYPFGFALLVTGYQTSILCARGYELVQTSFRGRMFHCLRPLGPRRGLQVQVTLFLLISIALFVIFCRYAAVVDPVAGAQYSVACGWIICSCILLLYHILFLFGFRGDPLDTYHKHSTSDQQYNRRNQNLSAFSLYLFFNVTEQYDDVDAATRKAQTSYVFYASVPIVIAVLSGIAFMISVNQVFFIGCVAATIASGFLVNFLTGGDSWDHSATLLRLAVAFSSVSWLYVVISVGFNGTANGWGGSLAVLLVTMVIWMACAVAAARFSEGASRRQWAFRFGYLIFVAHVIVSIVMLFVKEWRAGVLIVGLGIHSAISFFRYGASSKVGTLTSMGGFLALIVAIVVIGLADNASQTYSVPLSQTLLQNFTFSNGTSAGEFYDNYTMYPAFTACLSKFAPNIDIVAMSVLAAISYASVPSVLNVDLAAFFPGFQSIPVATAMPGVASALSNSFVEPLIFEETSQQNITVVVLRNIGGDTMELVIGMTMWLEAMAMTPAGLIIPTQWTASVVQAIAKVATDISPLPWKRNVNEVSSALQRVAGNYTPVALRQIPGSKGNNRIFVVGHDLAGGVASIAGPRAGLRTITFGAPGMVYSAKRFGFASDEVVDESVISVIAESSTLGLVGGISKKAVKLDCSISTNECRRSVYFVQSLQQACYPEG
ncbi:transmembrane protein, putative [Bodo saltans]|uniref:Transmembrane protein, putative n=1 Tax=Bodo saltans TaxID=75058 RepID=A0A0S4J3D4_BODSA|nr:transmembrane protein, putative [Bodo saltans]|eukprot:CUG85867.1 transmembrane protein, putative [Bodo saltans]